MKKLLIYSFLVLFIGTFFSVSCQKKAKQTQGEETVELTEEQRIELRNLISQENRKVPVMFGTIGLAKHMALKGSHMRIFVELNPNYFILDKIKEGKEVIRKDFYINLASLDDSFDPLFKKLAEYGIGLRVELGSYNEEDVLEIYFTADELKKLAASKQADVNPREALESHIAAYNLSLPVQIRDKTELKSILLKENYMQFNFCIDEVDGNEMNRLRAAKQVMSNHLLDSLKISKAHTVKEMLDLCRRSKVGINYRYIGRKSKQQVTLYFTSDEL